MYLIEQLTLFVSLKTTEQKLKIYTYHEIYPLNGQLGIYGLMPDIVQ